MKAPRCNFRQSVPWPGHGVAVLKHTHCRNRTKDPSGRCHLHRPVAARLSFDQSASENKRAFVDRLKEAGWTDKAARAEWHRIQTEDQS